MYFKLLVISTCMGDKDVSRGHWSEKSTGSDDERQESTGSDDERQESTGSDDERQESTGSDDERQESTGSDDERQESTGSDDERQESTGSDDERQESIVLSPEEQAEIEQSERMNGSLLADASCNYKSLSLSAAYWNILPSSTARVKALNKKHFILESLTLLNVDVFALQELPWVPKNFRKRILSVATAHDRPYFQRPYTIVGSSKEAVVLYDREIFDEVKQVYPGDLPINNERIVVTRMRIKRNTDVSFYFASVHMPYHTGGSDEEKTRTVKKLLTRLKAYSKKKKLPLFLAGDFNVKNIGDDVDDDVGYSTERIGMVDKHFWYPNGKISVIYGRDFDIFEKNTEGGYMHFTETRLQNAGLTVQGIEDAYVRGGSHRPVTCNIQLEILDY